ncbi:MAPEG family protein [Cognatishimia sp. 1_MG-2023]|uniref:MAPEG family protein n=1 Tax=Cognatishimia sp. 1_MG-2023 TaxID=3062642 RepID=UPI0026E30382|nr:MAPEG family protein [Cognatishimia sp. 1_MG-2023]MDO6726306.1 MAPEG family protein [Cognatishimia sp. 1_MG-2023]
MDITQSDSAIATTPDKKRKFTLMIIGYPIVLTAIALAMNVTIFGIAPLTPSLPDKSTLAALGLAAILLVINHSWHMTSTELTRLEHSLYATPEEWRAAKRDPKDASALAQQELARNHNAHRNATENTVIFACLAFVFAFATPTLWAATVWPLAFAIGRLGHSFGYLRGNDTIRPIFMSISLLGLYGMASYIAISLIL